MDFAHSLPMVLNRTLGTVLPPFRNIITRFNLTDPQWRVLRVLWENKKITTAELSLATLIPSPSLVGVLDRLEKRDLVTRTRSQKDRRVVHVASTKKGDAIANIVLPEVQDLHEKIRSSVSNSEWSQMIATLEKISASLNAQSQKNNSRKVS